MRTRMMVAALVSIVVSLSLGQISAGAADVAAEVRDNSYAPAAISIIQGDSVTWTVTGNNPHTVTSDTGAWTSSATMNKGDAFTVDFGAPGDYAYHCLIHGQAMAGTIHVDSLPIGTAPTTATTATTTSSATTATTAASTTSSSDSTSSSSTTSTTEADDDETTTTTSDDEEAAADAEDDDDIPGWLLAAIGLVILAIATLGGLLARARNKRDGGPPEPPETSMLEHI